MLIVSNGYSDQIFSCHQEVIDFFGLETFMALMDGIHSQFTMSYSNETL